MIPVAAIGQGSGGWSGRLAIPAAGDPLRFGFVQPHQRDAVLLGILHGAGLKAGGGKQHPFLGAHRLDLAVQHHHQLAFHLAPVALAFDQHKMVARHISEADGDIKGVLAIGS